MIGQLTVPTSESSIPQVAEGVFVARAEVADWTVEPVSHRCLTRLLDCDYPRWRDARSEDFRARFAATRHFAKSVVARVADLPVEDIELRRCTSGRPSFVVRGSGCSRVVDANLSHTRDSAVMAVSTRGPVGVDVEAQNRNLDDGDFARAICHDEELGEYERAQPPSGSGCCSNCGRGKRRPPRPWEPGWARHSPCCAPISDAAPSPMTATRRGGSMR